MPAPLVGAAVAAAARLAAKKLGQEAAKKAAKKVATKATEKLADSKVANKIANTKPGVAATKAVAKKVQASSNAKAKKAVNIIADSADKARAAQIAKNSVKVINPMSKRDRDFKNKGADKAVKAARSGSDVKFGEKVQKVMKPAKVVKINSAPAKSADAAKKSADAKALKAANKGKKK
jgi:hypothetical protein